MEYHARFLDQSTVLSVILESKFGYFTILMLEHTSCLMYGTRSYVQESLVFLFQASCVMVHLVVPLLAGSVMLHAQSLVSYTGNVSRTALVSVFLGPFVFVRVFAAVA